MSLVFQTPEQYAHLYNAARGNKPYSKYHGYAYDGIWTIALALDYVINNSIIFSQHRTMNEGKFNFGYKQTIDALNQTDFVGVTVTIELIEFKNTIVLIEE